MPRPPQCKPANERGIFLKNIILSKKNSKLRLFLLFLVPLQRFMP